MEMTVLRDDIIQHLSVILEIIADLDSWRMTHVRVRGQEM